LPETLRMDCNRLLTFRNDWQDITIMATLLILFRQASGPRCTASHQSEMKATLWVLLNDTDTSLSHIVLEVARTAGTIRGKAFSDAEVSSLSGLVEKTLSPESRLYGLVWSRIGEHLRSWLVSTLDRTLLARHGLTELETEMRDLSERLGKLGEFNRATYFEIYRQLYEESRALN
ncbi:T-complex 11, partial [Zopfochytrium polystomum]